MEWWEKHNAAYQNNKWTSHQNKEAESLRPVQMSIYQNNIPIEKTYASYISATRQRFKRGNKWAQAQLWQQYSMQGHMTDLWR